MSLVDRLEQLVHAFLWSSVRDEKRDHLVCWETLCKPKKIGGFGV